MTALAHLVAILLCLLKVQAQQKTFPATPLASKHFSYPSGIPYQADSDTDLIRGPQSGYNQCGPNTEGQDSKCQTSFLNSLDDFCLWAPMTPDSTIADTEGEEVAWCTKPGRGTRVIPAGALQGVQFMKTPDYVQVVGFIDQTLINIQAGDYGGELDPHGADLRGNPLGGLVYSTAFGTNDGNNYTQVTEWHNFMGGNAFCFKACDPAGANAAKFCQHIYDRIGCAYNAPNDAQNGTFESCLGDSQDFPGIYTVNGTVMTYSQPPERFGAISTMPYDPKVPASSSCTSFDSTSIYTALPSATAASSSVSASAKIAFVSGSASSTIAASKATGSRSPSASSTATDTNDAATLAMSIVATLFGTLFAAVFLS
uniref:Macrofage activating glycoprotein n=1 Tax=Mycena chlorophos TaxID=658473 RepID=A0ABQ0LDB6_MYCCL|nr:predicted protein [Mycena chlorophos]